MVDSLNFGNPYDGYIESGVQKGSALFKFSVYPGYLRNLFNILDTSQGGLLLETNVDEDNGIYTQLIDKNKGFEHRFSQTGKRFILPTNLFTTSPIHCVFYYTLAFKLIIDGYYLKKDKLAGTFIDQTLIFELFRIDFPTDNSYYSSTNRYISHLLKVNLKNVGSHTLSSDTYHDSYSSNQTPI